MAKFLQTLIPLALLLAAANTAQSQTTSFAYDFYGDPVPDTLTYQGDAHFPSDTTFLRLTKTNASGHPETHSVGRILHTCPVTFWQDGAQADFETTINFIINPVDNTPADGLVFFIDVDGASNTIPSGSSGGNFGIFSSSSIFVQRFAVEFDIFSNYGVDPTSLPHIGIDLATATSRNVTVVGQAMVGQQVNARINYVQATKLITARVTIGSQIFEVSYVSDLSNIYNAFSPRVQVGISAATGGNVAIHDIISWYFTSTLVQPNAADANIRQVV